MNVRLHFNLDPLQALFLENLDRQLEFQAMKVSHKVGVWAGLLRFCLIGTTGIIVGSCRN